MVELELVELDIKAELEKGRQEMEAAWQEWGEARSRVQAPVFGETTLVYYSTGDFSYNIPSSVSIGDIKDYLSYSVPEISTASWVGTYDNGIQRVVVFANECDVMRLEKSWTTFDDNADAFKTGKRLNDL